MIKMIHGDCLEYMKTMTDKIDAVVTDPPYGLKKELKRKWYGGNGKTKLSGENKWDERLDEYVLSLTEYPQVIIWGGNFYSLPKSDTWIIWDKLQDNRGSDAEMAWAKLPKRGCRVFRMSRIDAYFNKRIYPKEHPTEKPIQLMEFCVSKIKGVVFDPFMGVGSTGVACLRLGYDFIGIEKEKKYYDIAVKRIEDAGGNVIQQTLCGSATLHPNPFGASHSVERWLKLGGNLNRRKNDRNRPDGD